MCVLRVPAVDVYTPESSIPPPRPLPGRIKPARPKSAFGNSQPSKRFNKIKTERNSSFYATLPELRAATRRARELLKLPANAQAKPLKKEKGLVKRV